MYLGPRREFRILRFLGRGSYGSTWLAQEEGELKRRVVLKVYRRPAVAEEELKGLRTIAQVLKDAPPSLVKLLYVFCEPASHVASLLKEFNAGGLDAGVDPRSDELPVLVMDFVSDANVADRMAACQRADRGWLLNRIACDVIRALEFLSRFQIRHGDVRPANILITATNEAKLIDYGLAAPYGTSPLVTVNPRLNPRYRAPEELEAGREAPTIAADLYALGLVLGEQIAGTDWIREQLVDGNVVHPDLSQLNQPGCGESFLRLLHVLLSLDPEERQQAFLIIEESPGENLPAHPHPPRSATPWMTAVLVILVVAGLIAVFTWPPHAGQQQPRHPDDLRPKDIVPPGSSVSQPFDRPEDSR